MAYPVAELCRCLVAACRVPDGSIVKAEGVFQRAAGMPRVACTRTAAPGGAACPNRHCSSAV